MADDDSPSDTDIPDAPDAECPLEAPTSAESTPTAPPTPDGRADRVRIKTRETVSERNEVHPSAGRHRRDPPIMRRETSGTSAQSHVDTPKIKTREAVQQRTVHTFGDAVPLDAERQAVNGPSPQTATSKVQSVLRRREKPPLSQAKENVRTSSVDHTEKVLYFSPDIKTKDSYILRHPLDSPKGTSGERTSRAPDLGSRMKAWYMQRRRSAKESPLSFTQDSKATDTPVLDTSVFQQTTASPKRTAQIPPLKYRIKERLTQRQLSAEELLQALEQGSRTKDAVVYEKVRFSDEKPSPAHRQGEREFIQEQGRKEAVKRAKLRHSKKSKTSLPQSTGDGTSAPRTDSGPMPFTRQPSASPPTHGQSNFSMPDGQIERTVARDVRGRTAKGKNAVKTAKAGIKSSHRNARRTVKTAERSAKTAQKTQAAAKAPQRATRAAAKAGVTTARDVGKAALSAMKKAAAAARELAAAIMAGGWVVAVITLIICIVGLLVTSPFGLFFSDPGNGMTIPEAVAQLNGEFTAQIEQIKTDNPYDTLDFDENGITLVTENWSNVLAVYSVRVSSGDGAGASILTAENLAVLRQIFWDMNQITYATETVKHDEEDDETILHISITTKSPQQAAEEYGFTDDQKQLLEEMLKPEYQDLFRSLIGSGPGTTLTPQEVQDILSRMPDDISEERRQVVLTAYQLLGKVHYFWGGKSLVLGWDSRWGTSREVWAAGSPSTGTVRPYGLDCSGFVDWVFYNVSGGSYVIGHGGGAHMQHTYCTPITWAEAQPGDLVFYPEDTHVGIVCGFDSGGNVQIIHCASGSNNVVVTGKIGFRTIARPKYYS